MKTIALGIFVSLVVGCTEAGEAPTKFPTVATTTSAPVETAATTTSTPVETAATTTSAPVGTAPPIESNSPTVETAAPAATVPGGCTGDSTASSQDFVLYQGEALAAPVNNVINLAQGWRADEAWDNGRLQVEASEKGTFISFSNEGIYHGFKFTPPSTNGIRRSFTITGAEVYVELQRSNPAAALPTFGLRVIKPDEFEGNGGAPTTTWMLDKPANGTRFLTAKTKCSLISMTIPQNFIDQKSVGNRLIWEMQSNWNASDKIVIRKIVLKGFRFVP